MSHSNCETMENNLLGKMMQGNGSFGSIDLEGSMRVQHHHQQQQQHPFTLNQNHHSLSQRGTMVPPTIHEDIPLTIGTMHSQDRTTSKAATDVGKVDKSKCVSDEDDPCFPEGGGADGKGKKAIAWQRVKWTDQMVRLLITAVSYIGEEAAAEYGGGARRKYIHLQKKGKWKSISKVMAERGHFVSPQQCEDKFNDLNKRYKRLNEILGRGTSCEVVENPSLLDTMDHVSEKAKEEVRKILCSKHLHYEEMCSYYNGNRLHLPPDPELQRSLHLALRSKDEPDEGSSAARRHILHDDNNDDDDDHDPELDDEYEDSHEDHHMAAYGIHGGSTKRLRPITEDVDFCNFLLPCSDGKKQQRSTNDEGNLQHSQDAMKENVLQRQMLMMNHERSILLEEQKVQIQVQMLELERERFNWQRYSRKKDREIELMKLENERMRLENERLALELRRKDS